MRKILFLTLALMTIIASCSKPEQNSGTGSGSVTNPDEGGKEEEVVAATISLAQTSVNLGGSMFDFAEVSVSSNQTKITPVCNETWMTARMTGRILTITASENNETGAERTGTITITAGEGDNIATETLTVIQGLRDASSETPVIQLTSNPEDLAAAAGSTTSVSYTTNQSDVKISFDQTPDWLTYEIGETAITFTTLSNNTTGSIRSVEVTITAGEASATCTVRQFSDVPTGLTIGALYDGGMIFEIAADYIKIISLTEGKCFWASEETKTTYLGTDANPEDGGQANTSLIQSQSNFTGNFPAAEWCVALGEGWYLPSRKEFNTLIDNLKLTKIAGQESIQSFLASYSGDPLTIGTAYYWTCCEKDGTAAWGVRLNDKAHGSYSKGGSERPVRAVKKITMDVAGEIGKVGGGLGDFTITEETWTNN